VSLASPALAAELGGGGVTRRRTTAVFGEVAGLAARGELAILVNAAFPLDEAGRAVALVESGHATGNVVVTMQYRLGPLGWLVHLGLDAEAPDARSGNYGLEDLVAALKWVQRDIGAFGGNKDRVMIFGESAGGVNVCALLASPEARGLFSQAVPQSGAGHNSISADTAHAVDSRRRGAKGS